ncbi:MAG TPA: acyl-CoA dehydrogenase family protein [Dongiaceae bacterium]|nr:acyl-CoA dehydrogenase family protein [Dongiaceae bacterium]
MEAFDTTDDRAFRHEIRAFFRESLPEDVRRTVMTGLPTGREMADRWHKVMLAKGWAAPTWPKEHGGTGWSLKRQYIFEQERVAAWAPGPLIFNIDMVGPLFIRYGTPAQNARFLPRVLSGEDHWCQGFSEPGSGSDLASLKCRAVRKGDRYVINGAKIWQTAVYESDMMFGLFRTDSSGRKQQGISVLVLPLASKGLSLRPVLLLDGIERVAQCTFEDVEVPVENLIGEENQGWSIAKYLLTLERLGIAEVGASRACLGRLKTLAGAEIRGNEPLLLEPTLLKEIADVEADLDALEATEYRFLFDPQSNGELGPESSILKIQGTLIRQRLTELTMRVAGPFAQETATDLPSSAPDEARSFAAWATRHYFNFRKISIYGGSNEIQRNIVAKAVLGL